MIDQPKCFFMFPDPGVNFCKSSSGLWPIKGVLRFRQELDRLLAFVDCFLFPAQARKNSTKLPVATRIVRRVTHEFVCHSSGVLERCLRLHFIALIEIKSPFQESFRATNTARGSQCLSVKLLCYVKSIGELPLQSQNPNPS